jgi:hypothetical protein
VGTAAHLVTIDGSRKRGVMPVDFNAEHNVVSSHVPSESKGSVSWTALHICRAAKGFTFLLNVERGVPGVSFVVCPRH